MCFTDYDEIEFKEGQRLLADGKPCNFAKEDEQYGVLWVRFDGEERDRTAPIECVVVV
ncbi:MAG: Unknown protein [uncultured Sulfurovum sp.]|uniref:Uncharacterized protein n=1 Tax=uncultured Sulfurovum sp. TaxID=269237 RepID=A0A6S6SNW3_9BACT|nr:MAG: Unknown protein [uncultured Sulfurovum sp.]